MVVCIYVAKWCPTARERGQIILPDFVKDLFAKELQDEGLNPDEPVSPLVINRLVRSYVDKEPFGMNIEIAMALCQENQDLTDFLAEESLKRMGKNITPQEVYTHKYRLRSEKEQMGSTRRFYNDDE